MKQKNDFFTELFVNISYCSGITSLLFVFGVFIIFTVLDAMLAFTDMPLDKALLKDTLIFVFGLAFVLTCISICAGTISTLLTILERQRRQNNYDQSNCNNYYTYLSFKE